MSFVQVFGVTTMQGQGIPLTTPVERFERSGSAPTASAAMMVEISASDSVRPPTSAAGAAMPAASARAAPGM